MTPLEIMQRAPQVLSWPDGRKTELKLTPGLSEMEIAEFAKALPCPLPANVRELLAYCRSFTGAAVDFVDFTGRDCLFEYEPAFPHGLPIAADGFGNFWVVDLTPDSKSWGPLYSACHDPPVILFQSPSLEHFLTELFQCHIAPFRSLVDEVREDTLFEVDGKYPGVISHEQGLQSSDPVIRTFAQQLDCAFEIIDLRNAAIGFGFSWGRYGANTIVRRFGVEPVFACRRPPGIWRRLFSRRPH